MSTATALPRPSLRAQAATYVTGYFTLSLTSVGTLSVPLWALMIGASPVWIGIAVAARTVLPLIYAIHGGMLIDRIGPRRMLFGLGIAGMIIAPLHPLLPFVWALIMLQLFLGLTQNTNWTGAQSLVAKIGRGRPDVTGRFTFFTTLGAFSGPMLGGFAWDHFGAWGAFLLMVLFSAGILVASRLAPADAAPARPAGAGAGEARPVLGWGDLLPRLSAYAAAFRLALIPAVSVIVIGTFLRNLIYGIRMSFYPVYLATTDISPGEIGILMATGALMASPAGLLMGYLSRRFHAHTLMMVSQIMMTVSIGITPLFDDFVPLILLAGVFGFATGVNLPTLIASLSGSVEAEAQGLAIGLRVTVNLLGQLGTPLIMGVVAQFFGIGPAFYVIATLAMVLTLAGWPLVAVARRREAAH